MRMKRPTGLLAISVATGLLFAACGGSDADDAAPSASAPETDAASDTAAAASDEAIELSVLIDDAPFTSAMLDALTAKFTADHPNVTFTVEKRPGGAEGDNIVKTKLATGEMNDIFVYNSGSLLQALNPADTMVDLTGEAMLDNIADAFLPAVTLEGGVYGVPFGTGMGGGMLYNKQVFADNGIEVPKTWDEFSAAMDTLKAAGVVPVGGTFGDTWTSQLFVLADFYNVAAADPDWAAKYTTNEATYSDTPAALAGFERLQEAYEKGWYNEDYLSAKFDTGPQSLADGEFAVYPMLTFALGSMTPESAAGVGFFGQPGSDADNHGMTLWMPPAAYISETSEHADVAKEFLALIASVEGADIMNAASPPSGPLLIKGATLPADVLPAVTDMQAYVDAGLVTPALEFISPVKGPNLEKITVEVASGQKDAAAAAASYDEDVKKQAQQLALPGWD